MDQGRLNLRTVKHAAGRKHLVVISNLPVSSGLLQRAAAMVGAIYLYPPKPENSESKAGKRPEPNKRAKEDSTVNIDLGGSHSTVTLSGQNETGVSDNIEVGKVPPAANSFDREFNFWTLFNATDWQTGSQETGAMVASTRPSLLYNVLFGRLGEKAGIFVQALAAIAIFFGCIELIALFIGARLTRSMTKSVAELYQATESVNRGDLTPHQGRVSRPDGLAGAVVQLHDHFARPADGRAER